MLNVSQEADVGGFRSSASHYGGQYGTLYGSASVTGAQQVSGSSFFNAFVQNIPEIYALYYFVLCLNQVHETFDFETISKDSLILSHFNLIWLAGLGFQFN